MLRTTIYFLTLLSVFNFANAEYVAYTSKEMKKHKNKCIREMKTNPSNLHDPSYQMQRAIRTVLGDDADYIPKVIGAGEIFSDGETESYQLMHNGVKIIINSYYDTQWLTDVIYALKGHHEPQEEKCFYEILKHIPKNATMLELGSYWAYYSLWFVSEIEGGKAYLIEPDPKRLEVGKKNFELNNRNGTFRRGYIGPIIDNDPDFSGAECISIDEFIESEKITHIDILHADIQGSEYGMLLSAVNHLNEIDYFVISTQNHEEHHLPCLHFLKTHGYIILAEHTHAESCSGDGLIVAKRENVDGPTQITIRKY